MWFRMPDVAIADIATCDFGLLPSYSTEEVLRSALPDDGERYLESAVSRRLIADLGVKRRRLSHLPGQDIQPGRLTACDLARSAVERLRAKDPGRLERLDAVIFVSTSNPRPCNSQAALLARELGLDGSCFDLKSGCSGGVLGLVQAALLIQGGCDRILVVMAETLSHFTPADDLRMLLTVGDGAACVLLERRSGPGFLSVIHGSAPEYADTMTVPTLFPPMNGDARYVYRLHDAQGAGAFLHAKWRSLYAESIAAAGLDRGAAPRWFFHQTHAGQVRDLLLDLDVPEARTARVVESHGNMGTPTFAVALAQEFAGITPGEKYLLQAVGGGISWAAIVAEHA